MTESDKALMQQALDALVMVRDAGVTEHALTANQWNVVYNAISPLFEFIERSEAIAQPEQPTSGEYAMGYAEGFNDACAKPAQPEQTAEPAAWMKPSGDGYDSAYRDAGTLKILKATCATLWDNGDWMPLYTSPQAAQPEQTAVFYQFQTKDGEWHGFSDEAHRKNTVEAGRWPIRALYTAPQVAQPEQTTALAKVARDAITSLETISKLAGVHDYMQTLAEVRGYANSRATAASQEIANIAQPEQKANFCFRCGKLVSAIHDIHTCTPPVGHTN